MPVFDEAQKVSVEKKACKCGAQLIRVEYKEVNWSNLKSSRNKEIITRVFG